MKKWKIKWTSKGSDDKCSSNLGLRPGSVQFSAVFYALNSFFFFFFYWLATCILWACSIFCSIQCVNFFFWTETLRFWSCLNLNFFVNDIYNHFNCIQLFFCNGQCLWLNMDLVDWDVFGVGWRFFKYGFGWWFEDPGWVFEDLG